MAEFLYVHIPFLGIARPQYHVLVSDLYISRIGPHISCCRIVNRSPTHECGNWDCGRAIPFLGMFVSNFMDWFFAVGHVL
jgi:hypothetical protein